MEKENIWTAVFLSALILYVNAVHDEDMLFRLAFVLIMAFSFASLISHIKQ